MRVLKNILQLAAVIVLIVAVVPGVILLSREPAALPDEGALPEAA